MAEATSSSSPDEPRAKKPSRSAREFALARLSRRAHGENELRDKMRRARYSDASIEEALAFLHDYGYLDDGRFARELAISRARHGHWGPARIREKLSAARVDETHIDEAIRASFPEGEEAAAEEALKRYLATERPGAKVDPAPRGRRPSVRRARAYRHLLSRGYTPSLAHDLVSGCDFGDTDGLESSEFETK